MPTKDLSGSIISSLIIAIILSAYIQPFLAFCSYFPDVSDNYINSEAINWMKENNIIQGYDDGTFKPENQINRAELLKIIIEGFNFDTDVNTETGFPDVDESAWYGKYIRKAKSLDWIEGYPDGTFKPEQFINKAETLKILGKVKEWQTFESENQPYEDTPSGDWYTPFVSYAKNKNFLEETGRLFSPAADTSRAKFSEMVYRIIAVEESGANEYYQGLTPETVINSNIDPKIYDENFFNGIVLNQKFPNLFYKNEIYIFEGTLQNNKNNCFAYIALENQDSYKTFLGTVTNNICKIPVTFSDTGIQSFGIIPDLEGYNAPAEFEVLKNLPNFINSETSEIPENHEVQYSNNKTSFSFDNKNNNIIKINFYQNEVTKTFFNRQNLNEIEVPYQYFSDFSEGQIKWSVEGTKSKTVIIESESETSYSFEIVSPWSQSIVKTFIAAPYHTQILEEDKIEFSNLSDVAETNQKLEINGQTRSYIEKNAFLITPKGLVEKINITSDSPITSYYGNELYEPYSDFNLAFTPTESGSYLLEINDENGIAVFNNPIYVGNIIPLIPDFFTLNQFVIEYDMNINLENFKNEMLDLINNEREKLLLTPFTLTENLNEMAQSHSEDMVKNNFFSHITPEGESPEDRRLMFGIPMPVSENLVKSVNLQYAHESLMRSAAHRENIISQDWTIIGIGISQDDEGYLVITEEFSKLPLTNTDLQNIENDLLADINNLRNNKDKNSLFINNSLDSAAENWSEKMISENFFSFEAPNGDSLLNSINQQSGEFSFIILEGTFISDFFNLALEKENTLISGLWNSLGIGMASSGETGDIKVTIIFST